MGRYTVAVGVVSVLLCVPVGVFSGFKYCVLSEFAYL